MRTALVTGSSGFVGRHLVPPLVEHGYAVCSVDIKRGMSAQEFFHYWPDREFDVVVSLAANILDVDARMRAGVSIYDDISLDLETCKWVQKNPPKECFVVMSSCAVDCPADPYAWIKLSLEQFAGNLHKQGIPVAILRPFSGYGGDQAESYPFPAILKRAQEKQDPLTVWSSTSTVRDWLHIDDLVRAIIWAIKDAPRGVPIEIGSGIPTDFGTLARKMADAVGYSPAIKALTDKINSSDRRVRTSNLAEQYGFTPRISLEEGIQKALHQEQHQP